MKIIIEEKENLAKRAGDGLTELLRKSADREIFLMLSGGSCLAATDHISPEILRPNITIGPLDDRFSADPRINNWLSIKSSGFYRLAVEADVRIADILPEKGESKEALAKRYESLLREWRAENPEGIFLALLGIGEDGHTAGIMPYPENSRLFAKLFGNDKQWIVAYDTGVGSGGAPLNKGAPLFIRERITATATFLRKNLAGGVCFVSGVAKLPALRKLAAETGSLPETPARLLREIPNLTVFTDIHT